MRDAENIAEQVLAYCVAKEKKAFSGYKGIKIDKEKTLVALQILPEDVVMDFFSRIFDQNLKENVLSMSSLLRDGYQLVDFLYDFINVISSFLLYKVGVSQLDILKVSEAKLAYLEKNHDLFSQRDLYLMLDIGFDFLKELRVTRDVDICGKLFLYKIHNYKNIVSPEELRENLLLLAQDIGKESPKFMDKSEKDPLQSQQNGQNMVKSTIPLEKKVVVVEQGVENKIGESDDVSDFNNLDGQKMPKSHDSPSAPKDFRKEVFDKGIMLKSGEGET